jgi:hypothetical protein
MGSENLLKFLYFYVFFMRFLCRFMRLLRRIYALFMLFMRSTRFLSTSDFPWICADFPLFPRIIWCILPADAARQFLPLRTRNVSQGHGMQQSPLTRSAVDPVASQVGHWHCMYLRASPLTFCAGKMKLGLNSEVLTDQTSSPNPCICTLIHFFRKVILARVPMFKCV